MSETVEDARFPGADAASLPSVAPDPQNWPLTPALLHALGPELCAALAARAATVNAIAARLPGLTRAQVRWAHGMWLSRAFKPADAGEDVAAMARLSPELAEEIRKASERRSGRRAGRRVAATPRPRR